MDLNKHNYWLFDLDDTLHRCGNAVFPVISLRMTRYIMTHLQVDEAEAHRLRKLYWHRYGATLGGLVRHHRIDAEHFLHQTHDMHELLPLIDSSTQLARLLSRLPGRKWVFSNGPQHYVEAIVRHMGIGHVFDEVFGMQRLGKPKPHLSAYMAVLRHAGIAPGRCIMVEDSVANLRTAKQLGMRTVWISTATTRPSWVDWRIRHLADIARLPLTALPPKR